MVDVNKIIRNILVSMNLEDVTVCFYHPDEKQELPVITIMKIRQRQVFAMTMRNRHKTQLYQ